MKKMFMAAMLVAMGWMMTSCGGTSTPEDVVKKSFTCLENKDYAGYLELIDFKEKDGKSPDEIRKQVLPLMEDKAEDGIEKKGGHQELGNPGNHYCRRRQDC